MAGVTLAAREDVALAASDLYALFGAREGASWLFDASCDSVAPGAPVTLTVPAGPDGSEPMPILGRITRCIPGRLIEIAHDQPWQGLIRIKLTPIGPFNTRVTISAELDESGLSWIMRRRGWPDQTPKDPSVHRIGLITSKTGPAAVYTVACEYLARLAVAEMNEEGGLAGRRVELIVADDATDPRRAASEARHLVALGCRAIIASVTSASFESIRLAVTAARLPLIHPHVNEGGGDRHVFRWGERPLDQVRAVASRAMANASGRRWYLVGNTYSWAYGAHRQGTQAIVEAGGTVAGRQRVPLGTTDFSSLLEDVQRTGADCVLSALVGADEVAFERQVSDLGLRNSWQTLSLAIEESTLERIGPDSSGIWAAMGYFQSLDTAENTDLLARYRASAGTWAPPISTYSESMYEAFVLYAAAVRNSPKDDNAEVVRQLQNARARLPRGQVASHGADSLTQDLYVARSDGGSFQVVTG